MIVRWDIGIGIGRAVTPHMCNIVGRIGTSSPSAAQGCVIESLIFFAKRVQRALILTSLYLLGTTPINQSEQIVSTPVAICETSSRPEGFVIPASMGLRRG